ncbi:DUF3494 domain-containing protein, partial [Candidatus Parcubacteria bacterium]|nr:DUF3494 domain-containing protein [Candidatus Parcubacteria bacterium]
MDSSNTFSTSSLVAGKVYAPDYTPPTPAYMTTAVSNMETAYTDAAGRTLPDATELGAGDITSMTLAPGLYKWGTGVLISAGGVTLTGSANDVWIFQIAGTLTVSSNAIVTLSGGAQAKNIFWQVAGQTTLGTMSQFKGNILDQTAIVLNTGATLDGRALAQTAVTLDANSITANEGATLEGRALARIATVTSVENDVVPQAFSLDQNYPNPFNPSTKIQYTIGNPGLVSLKVYDVLGNEVATLVNSNQEAGSYTVPFNTS